MKTTYLGAILATLLLAAPAAAETSNANNPPARLSTATAVGIGSPGAVATDVNGNLYFSSEHIVFKLDQQGRIARVAGDGTAGFSGDGRSATAARLNIPLSYPELIADPIDFNPLYGPLAVDRSGNLFIGDAYNSRVRKVDTKGMITTIAGGEQFVWPQGVALDADGNVFIVSAYGYLGKLTPSGTTTPITTSNCGPGLCAPVGIALDRASNILVADGYCRVRKVSQDGSVVTIVGLDTQPSNGSRWTCGYSGDGGPARDAALNYPQSVAVDANGNYYIADTYNHCIRKVDGAGIITTVAGKCTYAGFAGDGGAATSAQLHTPVGVAVDPAGSIYIADTGNKRIRKVDPNGVISTVAGNGEKLSLSIAATPADYSDMWWAGPAENGWGMSIQQHGSVQFNTLYVYDSNGEPTWYVMPGGSWNEDFTRYTGALYQPTSAPLDNYTPSRFVVGASRGDATLDFTSASTATLGYTIDGVSGQKSIQRMRFGDGIKPFFSGLGDMWWGGPLENGWGLNLVQQDDIIFGIWCTYGTNGKPTWYVMPNIPNVIDTLFAGRMYRTTGSAWLGVTYDPNQLSVTDVGNLTLIIRRLSTIRTFDQIDMSYTFSAGPFARSKQFRTIVRLPY